ncbi:hypothetical protein [Phaeobacter piscinae]|uniref:hypothetical protein n=1 Tax=Phaeobacter piscinae TaxID=1580596 RepID=UPI000BBF159F|nr:hypothetical protein [Phaeobacter piscinae]ATG41934.1 hypothetical protein PhaeoP14_03902 [Phaeobacter piscinae]
MTTTWGHRLIWQDYVIDIRHVSAWHNCPIDHLEIKTASPKGAALPITETGYRSHFLWESNIIDAGGATAYVEAWFEEASQTHEWKAHVEVSRQGVLL